MSGRSEMLNDLRHALCEGPAGAAPGPPRRGPHDEGAGLLPDADRIDDEEVSDASEHRRRELRLGVDKFLQLLERKKYVSEVNKRRHTRV